MIAEFNVCSYHRVRVQYKPHASLNFLKKFPEIIKCIKIYTMIYRGVEVCFFTKCHMSHLEVNKEAE